MRSKKKEWAQTNDNTRFLWLTLSVFCLVLGIAMLLLVLLERLFFELSHGKLLVLVGVLALAAGGALSQLIHRWQR